MFNKRVKIFVALITVLLLLSMLRLSQMQLLKNSFYRGKITELKRRRWRFRQLKTVRGTILDRKQRPIAADSPCFTLNISYELSSFFDDRIIESRRAAAQQNDPKLSRQIDTKKQELKNIIGKCAQLKGVSRTKITNEINRINDYVWGQRAFQAWRRKFPDAELIEEYKSIVSVPLNEALEDFKQKIPDRKERLKLISETDIEEMHKRYALLELETDDALFTAQLEFMNTDDVQIVAEANRTYFYDSVACQTIGWVGPATQAEDRELFADDKLLRYLTDDVCGREDGVEFVCEPLLRGRRGEEVYDIDHQLVKRSETQLGDDITLTLDIELQERIEHYIQNVDLEPYCGPGFSVVLIEVFSGDILALVSLPVYDLNTVRYNYNKLINDPGKPMINRAINKRYPPGSVVKPLILIAGLESGEISPEEIISCLPQPAPEGWPNCWLYNRYNYLGHDTYWANNARNAIRGSCNIYFSQLANRIEPGVLQKWLFKFGYGHCVRLTDQRPQTKDHRRNTQYVIRRFRQLPGVISSTEPPPQLLAKQEWGLDFNDVPGLTRTERRFFGIGQGNLRATPLQVANAMAIIARGGLYKNPRLFPQQTSDEIPLNISENTLNIIRDGMHAVVSEIHGTAYKEFQHTGFDEQNVKVYGKTGSTEAPNNAWFAGFAEDHIGRGLSIALVVEGGQHGSSDAAPLARDIIQFCIEAGYIGKTELGLN